LFFGEFFQWDRKVMTGLFIFLLVGYFECLFGWCDIGEDIVEFMFLFRVEGIEFIEVSFNVHSLINLWVIKNKKV